MELYHLYYNSRLPVGLSLSNQPFTLLLLVEFVDATCAPMIKGFRGWGLIPAYL